MNTRPYNCAKDQQTAWLEAGRRRPAGKPVWRPLAARSAAGMPRRTRRPAAFGWLCRFAAAAAACALAGVPAWQALCRHAHGADVIVVAKTEDPNEGRAIQQPGMPPRPDKEELFDGYNHDTVGNGPTNPTIWTTREPVLVTWISTYHWNDGQGAAPGKISLKHEDGTIYGPWQTRGSDSVDGVNKNINWTAQPRVTVKPGTYTVVDSDPPTWAQNAVSGQRGFVRIEFRRLGGAFLAASPLAKGLVALWAADGDARDGAGDNHGQIKEGATFAEGKFGQAFKLDGDSGHIEFPSSKALHIAGDQTISMWIKPERLDKTRFLMSLSYNELRVFVTAEGVLGYSYGTDGSPRWEHVELNTGPGAEHTVESGAPVKLSVEGRRAVVRPGEWAHVAAVRDLKSRKLRWYVNGEMVCQGPAEIAAPSISGEPLFVGRTRLDFARFCGRIDDVGIWNRALSAEEVRLLYLAPGLRNAIMASGTMAVAPAATRVAGADRVLAKDGTVLIGALENPSFALTTTFGKMEIAARDLAGIVPVEGAPGKVWLLLADDQAVRGELADPVLSLKLAGGSTLRIPLKDVRECGLRAAEEKPASSTEAATASANPMMVILRSGERLACADLREDLSLETPYGRVAVPAKVLLRIEPSYGGLLCHRLVLRSGSQLSGKLLQEKLALKLQLGPEAVIGRQEIVSLYRAGEAAGPGDQASMQMRSDDVLVGEIADKTLTLRTRFGNVQFAPASASEVRFDPAGGARAAVRLWNGSSLSGELVEPAVTFTAWADGPALKLPVAQLASIARSTVLPPAEIVEKVRKLIAQLGAESYIDRQAATDLLIKLGPGIIPLLEKHLDASDPEVRARLAAILEKLRPQAKDAAPPQNPQQPGWGGGLKGG